MLLVKPVYRLKDFRPGDLTTKTLLEKVSSKDFLLKVSFELCRW